MPVFTNDITNSKTIKLENTSGSRGIYLIWDDVNENLLTTIINNDVNYVPNPLPSESMFIYDALGIEKLSMVNSHQLELHILESCLYLMGC